MIRYIETQSLMLYVMDNSAPETQNYIGYIDIPLYKLLSEGMIRDKFDVKSQSGKVKIVGGVYLEIKLQRASAIDSKFKNVEMKESLTRDKLNEIHKKAKMLGGPDYSFGKLFDNKKLID